MTSPLYNSRGVWSISSPVAASVVATGGSTVYGGVFLKGENNALVGELALVQGFTNQGNNGGFEVESSTATTITLSNPRGILEVNTAATVTVFYNYLDAVTYGRNSYICTTSSGSLNQRPDQNLTVWVQMPVVAQEDQYYLRSREDLLQYEDARYQSLINAMANFYTMRNDQSIWGSFLRAIAIELARIEYMYSYDVVAKNPQYLTPSDIKREYADPLFITGNFQQLSQFDSGSFGASFGQWADAGVILRTAILDSNGNIQIATTAGHTGSVQPSWALMTGMTTDDGSVIWTNAGAPPDTLAYPIGYRDMLVDLLAAYQEGATAKSIQDVIYAYTGKNIIVEELYKEISEGFYDQSDRNAVKVSVNVGGSDPFTNISSLEELQQITNSLYGAIDLAKPAHVGLEFTTVFGADENIDAYISPRYLTQFQLNTLPENQQAYYNLIAYVSSPIVWAAKTSYALEDIIQDSNGYLQQVTAVAITSPPSVVGVSGTVKPNWTTVLNATTPDSKVIWTNIGVPRVVWVAETNYVKGSLIQDTNGNIQLATNVGVSGLTSPTTWNTTQGTTIDGQITWVNIGTPQISIAAYTALSSAQQLYYEGYYVQSPFIMETPPLAGWQPTTMYPMGILIVDSNGNVQWATTGGSPLPEPDFSALTTNLVQYDILNPTFGTFPFSSGASGLIEPGWSSLGQASVDNTITWVNLGPWQFVLAQMFSPDRSRNGKGIDDTLRIIIQQYEEPPFDPMLYQAPIFDVNNPTTTLASYGRRLFSPLSQANWLTLQNTPSVWSSANTYSKGMLVRGVNTLTPGSFSGGVWTQGGWQLYRALKKNGVGSAAGVQNPLISPAYWAPLVGVSGKPAPSIYQAYYRAANGQYIAGNLQPWAPTTSFYTGQYMIDNNGNLELAVHEGTTSPVINVSSSSQAVVIQNNILTLSLTDSDLASMGLVIGVSKVTIFNFTFATFLNGLTLPVTALGTEASPPVNTISMTYNHADYNSELQNEGNAIVRIAFSTALDVPTYDGTVLWQFLGSNYLNNPAKWIQVVNPDPTGEVANWDVNHQMGLLAPRQDLCWEIGGGDTFSSYEYEG